MRDFSVQDTEARNRSGLLLDETFTDDRRAGSVIGTRTPDGHLRGGTDREGRIAIDHGALRFQPLAKPGWGRQGLSYGPYPREAGLAFAVAITNGHNTSQSERLPESLIRRLWRWARGPGADPVPARLWSLATGPRRRGLLRRFAIWLRASRSLYAGPDINENLAIGWFGHAAPTDPTTQGSAFVVHAALGDNGEVWVRNGPNCLPAFRSLKNVRVYYIVVLRERGAIYYAATGPDATTLPESPMMRPVAVDPFDDQPQIHAGIHQAALGQIGFRVDTRVHGAKVALLPELARSAPGQLSDPLTGSGSLHGTGWRVLRGEVHRTERGALSEGHEGVAILEEPQQTGLIHAIFEFTRPYGAGAIIWRHDGAGSYYALELDNLGACLVQVEGGTRKVLASDDVRGLPRGTTHSVQVLDDKGRVGCYLDGVQMFGQWIDTGVEQRPMHAGLMVRNGVRAREYECHPSEVPIPSELRFAPPWRRLGARVVAMDSFTGPHVQLDGRQTETGESRWMRTFGTGRVETDGNGARVVASVAAPNPGRTFHTLSWPQSDFADIEAVIEPPGRARGEKEHCRSGVVFWQDEDNYLSFSVYLADEYQGASIALFTKRHGFEELFDAIWTMVGSAISWGRPFTLRVTLDGNRFVVFVNDEAVMERALTDLYPDDPDLVINRVGLATNWEWGDDTGSTFRKFVARA